MEAIKFTGWVEKVYDATAYSRDFTVANYQGESGKDAMMQAFKDRKSKDWPVALKISANIKSGSASQLDLVSVGDKVEVQFLVGGKSGISQKSGEYYCINSLNLAKKDGIRVIQKRSQPAQQQQETFTPDTLDDCPF